MFKTITCLCAWAALAASAGTNDWTWYEREALPLEGKGFADTASFFSRLPARADGVLPRGVTGQGRQSTGLYVRFRTDANRLALRWTVANEHPDDPLIPAAGMIGVDVYRFDAAKKAWVFIGNKRYWGNKANCPPGEAEFGWRPGEAGIVYLPTRGITRDFKIGVPKGKKLEAHPHADPHAKPIVHYGTSIVHGGCASRPGLTFTAIAGRELDLPYVNLGFSGAGRMEKEVPAFLAEIDASIYVVDCSWNMYPDMVRTNAVRFLRTLKSLKPDTPILLCEGCSQFAAERSRPGDVILREGYEALKREDPVLWRNLYYFNAKGMLPENDICTHDFCHPNDYGSQYMGPVYARRIREVLEAEKTVREPLRVDFSSVVGPVKPVNGVGQPPIQSLDGTNLFHYLREAGIPYSRLHDVGGVFGKNVFVDIPNLFRDFDADETKAENYDFFYTDLLIKALVANGVEPYFRLGVTIENAAGRGGKAYRISPPKDYAKWARICEHVIRHYTEGWANGYRMKISHWEIWNEPENWDTLEENQMWKAPFADYIRLYVVAARHLKAKFPHLQIGGYASCGFYGASTYRKMNSRLKYLMDCFPEFLAAVRREKAPFDFFSFHCYDQPQHAVRQFAHARRMLDDYGFNKTTLSCNEWLTSPCTPEACGTVHQAAQIAAMLVALQEGPVDDAEIYDARCGIGAYSPLFNGLTSKPYKAYSVFLAFNELRKLGTSVSVTGAAEGLWATAATDGRGKGAVLIANISGAARAIPESLGGWRTTRARLIDAEHDFVDVPTDGTLANDAVLLLECAR